MNSHEKIYGYHQVVSQKAGCRFMKSNVEKGKNNEKWIHLSLRNAVQNLWLKDKYNETHEN